MAELFNQQTSFRKNVAAAAAVDGSGLIPTYSYASFGNTLAATPTDVVVLAGAAGKIIKVRRIVVSGIATTAGSLRTDIVKRSAANSGGTSTAPTPVPFDSADPAASGVISLYTANPTVGTLLGILTSRRVFLNLTTAAIDRMAESFGISGEEPLVIRSGEYLAINHGGATLPTGAAVDYQIVWTEE